MNTYESEHISAIFAAGSRDLTPASAPHNTYVLYAPVSCDPKISGHCASVLSDSEMHRADRFASEFNKAQFQQRRAFRRFCGATALGSSLPLSQIVFEETETGRPYLSDAPDLWFSFSSSRCGFLGAWSSTHAVGVDLEDPTRNLEATELARRYFSEAEANVVEELCGPERSQAFFQFWCLKEAALKSIGEGLPFGLDRFEIELDLDPRVVNAPDIHGEPDRYSAHLFTGSDYCAALVTRGHA